MILLVARKGNSVRNIPFNFEKGFEVGGVHTAGSVFEILTYFPVKRTVAPKPVGMGATRAWSHGVGVVRD